MNVTLLNAFYYKLSDYNCTGKLDESKWVINPKILLIRTCLSLPLPFSTEDL